MPKKYNSKPVPCNRCKDLTETFVMILTAIDPVEEHITVCDDCYHTEMAKPIREWGVQT